MHRLKFIGEDMKYENMVPGVFLARPNRFIAHVEIAGTVEICHVKNTGRCRELLPPGAQVYCQRASNPQRKTQYDLITVRKGDRLINMDSQAPNGRSWNLSTVSSNDGVERTIANGVDGTTIVKDGSLALEKQNTEHQQKKPVIFLPSSMEMSLLPTCAGGTDPELISANLEGDSCQWVFGQESDGSGEASR